MGCDSRVSFSLCLHILPSLFYGVQKLVKTKPKQKLLNVPALIRILQSTTITCSAYFFLFPYRTHGNREGWKQNLTASRRAKDCDFPHAQCYVGLDQREKGLPYLASRCKMHPLLHSTQPKPTALRQERSGQTREMYEGIRTPKG